MMIGLATYMVKIRERGKNKKKGYYKFDKLPKDTTLYNMEESRYYDAIDVLYELFDETPRFKDIGRNKISDIIEKHNDEDRIIHGLVGYGSYGTPSTIVHKDDEEYKEELTEDKGVEHHFYFMFKLPKGQDVGILFLERRSNYGLKSLLYKWLNKTLGEHKVYKRFSIDIDSLFDKRVFEKYVKEGVLHNLEYSKHTIPKSSFEKRKFIKGKMKVNVKFDNHPHLNDVFNHVNIFDNKDKKARKEFLTFNGELYDDLTFKIDAGDSPRTFRYSQPEKSAPYLDITSEFKGKNVNPSLKSIHEVAKKYEKDMISNIWRTD